jgi:hypothetical protein
MIPPKLLFTRLPTSPHLHKIIETSNHIPPQALSSLLHHNCIAVLVKNFLPQSSVNSYINKIEEMIQQGKTKNWMISQSDDKLVKSDVDTIGMPLNIAVAQKQEDLYYDMALTNTRLFREWSLEQQCLSPFDKLRLELDEIHPFGAILGRETNPPYRPRNAGLVRVMKRNTAAVAAADNNNNNQEGLIHCDDIGVHSISHGVFSANIYLQTSLVGGELDIWPVLFETEEDLYKNAFAIGLLTTQSGDEISQKILRQHILPVEPPITIKPQSGDLILLNVQRPHAVKGPLHGPRLRLSAQTFITNNGEGKPLVIEV